MNKINPKNTISYILVAASLIVGSIAVVRADVPIPPTPAGVDCSCVTSSTQTCASKIFGKYWYSQYTSSDITSCSSGAYSVLDIPVPPQKFYSFNTETWTSSTVANKKEATGNASVTYVPHSVSIGYDTGTICTKAGGITGTLKVTGTVPFTIQGLCLVGTCTYSGQTDINYSCY